MPTVYVFQSEGQWLVTVSHRGGRAAKFPTQSDAEKWAERKAILLGLDGFTVLPSAQQ